MRMEPFLKDKVDLVANTVYKFDGCYFNTHLGDVTKNLKNQKWLKN